MNPLEMAFSIKQNMSKMKLKNTISRVRNNRQFREEILRSPESFLRHFRVNAENALNKVTLVCFMMNIRTFNQITKRR
jgi:hypothetical protein